MKVIIDPHTLERAEERGTTEDEIIDVIQTGLPIAAKYDRQGKAKIFPYRKKRQNKYYEQKKIEVYYVIKMNISYNDKNDLLYIRLDDKKQAVINRRVSDDVVLDMGEKDRIVGIEIVNASRRVSLDKLFPVQYEARHAAP
ncbi:MAG: DUF2283 domain-containing protein [Deltaproteobacteria bacterium]|nr:DUF2283 domain-containing protein [Deltaproteobacteria bacterium]